MPETMEIRLRTLTPLWTGGADRRSDRLRVTGIIGSLRWWYEALVRGLGGYACDPSLGSCLYDDQKPGGGICAACRLFGTTGWARRFRLGIVSDGTEPEGPVGARQPDGDRFSAARGAREPSRPSWYFSGPGRGGAVVLSLVPLAPDFEPNVVLGLCKLIERHAGLAARTQLGYGWVRVEDPQAFDVDSFVQQLQMAASSALPSGTSLPAFHEMFFAEIETDRDGLTPALNARYDVRAALRRAFPHNGELRHFVCGTVRGKREGSKLSFSQAVRGRMRVWGWIPRTLPGGALRDQVISEIRGALEPKGCKVRSWREHGSARDTLSPSWPDRSTFLASLLQEGQS